MKLLARYNRVTLVTTVIVLLITGVIYYAVIDSILTHKVDKDLAVEENEIFEYVSLDHHLPQVFESNDLQIKFTEAPPGSVARKFIDTVYLEHKRRHGRREEYETARGLISSVTAGDKYYKVQIVESTVETEVLLKIIFSITIGVILLLLITLFIANRVALSRLWKPFHNLLKEVRLFNVADTKEIPQLDTTIDEFKELNVAVASMASRVKSDYKDLKTFTENASHELLTPIAVINSKLDTLLQTDNFSQQQSKLLNDLYTAVSKLTRLNQSLLLLVKIENHLLEGNVTINLRTAINEIVIQFEEIYLDKGLKVECELTEKQINANPYLIDVLLNNLLSNAIRHNHHGGEINIRLTEEQLSIQNTGGNEAIQKDQLFKRFHKSTSSEGSGLGLTISREICENLGFNVVYNFADNYHTFTVKFNN